MILFDLGLILLVGLLSISWFRGNYLIKVGDSFFSLDAAFSLREFSSQVWAPWATGVPSPLSVISYFFFLQMSILKFIGISLVVQQKMLFYTLFTIGGLGMYALFSTLATNDNKRIGGLAAALFYMMNLFALSSLWGRQGGLYSYALLPLFLALFAKGLCSEKGYIRYLFLILGIWFLAPISMINPGYWLPIWMVQLSFLIFFVARNRNDKATVLHALRFSGLLALLWFVLNLWWILPLSILVSGVYAGTHTAGEPAAIFQWTSLSATLVNSFRLLGDWTIYEKYGSEPYYSWALVYFTPFFVLISFIPPLLAFASLFFKSMRRYAVYFAFLAIAGLFLIKGPHVPLGWLNTVWFNVLPFSGMFRSTYEKLGPVVVLSYAFLIGTSIAGIFEYLRTKPKVFRIKTIKITPILFIVLIFTILYGVLVFPFWTGEVLWAGSAGRPSYRVQVPEYYHEAAKWFEKQPKENKVLTLPPSLFVGGYAYKWKHGYFGSDPLDQYFVQRPLMGLLTGSDFADEFQKEAIINLLTQNSETASKMLGLLNVKYILVHRDFHMRYAFPSPRQYSVELAPKNLEKNLRAHKEFQFAGAFGDLAIYTLKSELFVPQIYAGGSSRLGVRGVDSLAKMVEEQDSSKSQVFFLLDPSETKNYREVKRPLSSKQKAVVSFKRVSPTLYKVKIKNSTAPFYLTFSETFDPYWKAYEGNVNWFQALWKKPIDENRHLRANGYANSWYIDKKGDYEMTLYFWPQSLVNVGAFVSGMAFLSCVGYLVWDWRRQRKPTAKRALEAISPDQQAPS